MSDDQAPLAKDLLWEALEVEPARRAALLEERCGADLELRARVQGLLAAHESAGRLFSADSAPWAGLADEVLRGHAGELAAGDQLGPYRILEIAGSGGFGTVYLAEQREPVVRRVALKLLRNNLASAGARARFDAERQALARMEHPGIARVFDAGTTADGRPWFVMEYLPGLPITEFCERHALDLHGRLELFREVCRAIQHAHHKGVVHRDLKPSNVLVSEVDGRPSAKVIDFGVAKAIEGPLTDLSLVSLDGQLIGTPAYMSPEQAAGEMDVDTRSDVYGLGALLYELLAGVPPFDSGALGFVELLDAIANQDPPRPGLRLRRGASTTQLRSIPEDLDWICMRCLEKQRARRYPSASALADDVERFLEGRPVEAAPPSTWYRLVKLTRRHRLAVGAAATVAVVLVGGVVGTSVGLLRAGRANLELGKALATVEAEAERARQAERQAAAEALRATTQWEVARAVNDFVNKDLLAAAVPSVERGRGRDVLLREVIDVASESLEAGEAGGGRFQGKPEVEASIRNMLGTVYAKLGEYAPAVRHLRRAVALRTQALGARHPDTLDSAANLGTQLRNTAELDESEELLETTLEAQREVLGSDHLFTLWTQGELGRLWLVRGRHEDSYELLLDAAERARRALGPQHPATLSVLSGLAVAAQRLGHADEAESAFQGVFDGRRELLGRGHPDTVDAQVNLATFLRSRARFRDARELIADAHEHAAQVLGPEHPSTLIALFNLGAVILELHEPARAEELLGTAVEALERVSGPDDQLTLSALGALARSIELQGRQDEAVELFREAYSRALAALGPDHPTTDARRKDLSGALFHDPDSLDEVLELTTASYESQLRAMGPRHPNTLRAMVNLATFHTAYGSPEEAEALLQAALEIQRSLYGPDHLQTLRTESDLVGLWTDTGRSADAEPLARHTVEVARRDLAPDDYDLARFRLRLGLALRELGGERKARELFETAHASLLATRGAADKMTVYAAEELADWGAGEAP